MAFHGRTMGALSATYNEAIKAPFGKLLEGFITIPFDDINALKNTLTQYSNICAVMLEPIQGEAGVITPKADYLSQVRQLCDDHNVLMMLDEVQTGNGRTGAWYAWHHTQAQPDVMTTAKGLGNGIPIGATFVAKKATTLFKVGHHGSTFGGNPIACSAALAVINTINQPDFLTEVTAKGAYLKKRLLEECHRHIDSIQGEGLMLGVKLNTANDALAEGFKSSRLLVNINRQTTIRLLPPLTITTDEIDQLVDRFSYALSNRNKADG